MRSLVYKFQDGRLNNLDAVQNFKHKIRKKNLTIFGDSLQLQLFEGLREVLNVSEVVQTQIRQTGDSGPANLWLFHHGNQGWIHYLRFYRVELPGNKRLHAKYVVNVDTIKALVSLSDIVIFNIGYHYDQVSVMDFHNSLTAVTLVLNESLVNDPDKIIILKATTPPHFQTYTGSGLYRDFNSRTNNSDCAQAPANQRHPTSLILQQFVALYKFKFYELFEFLKDRWDLHVKECAHFCFSFRAFHPQLVLLGELL